jgi:hypothetical protein
MHSKIINYTLLDVRRGWTAETFICNRMNRRTVTVVQPGKIVLPAFAAAFDYIED